jgi:hypothetical protein
VDRWVAWMIFAGYSQCSPALMQCLHSADRQLPMLLGCLLGLLTWMRLTALDSTSLTIEASTARFCMALSGDGLSRQWRGTF